MAQIARAILLANATATSIFGFLPSMRASHDPAQAGIAATGLRWAEVPLSCMSLPQPGKAQLDWQELLNLAPDRDPRTFGFRKLSDLIRKTNQFDVQQAEGGPVSIRVKQRGKK